MYVSGRDMDGSNMDLDLPMHQVSSSYLRDSLLSVELSEKFTCMYFKTDRARRWDRRSSDRYVRRIWLQLQRRGEVR